MAAAHPSATKHKPAARRHGGSTWAALLIGVPLGVAILAMIQRGPLDDPAIRRYVQHPVEWVEVVMFCCALGALAGKLRQNGTERRALRAQVLPDWDGQRLPVADATHLFAHVSRLPRRLQNSFLGRRVGAALDFLCSRGSAAELDDQLRALADNDALAVENGGSLVRFITWAIPILGFLGTVLGITQAISGATPERLEQSLSTVTDGLAEAFDCTALALALTMLTMFLSFLVDRGEQTMLEAIDAYTEQQLAHRFERPAAGGVAVSDEFRQDVRGLVEANERLVQRQAEIWAQTLEHVHRERAAVEQGQQERFVAALEKALERTLHSHEQRLGLLEKQTLEQGAGLVKQIGVLAAAIRETGGEQQEALRVLGERTTAQVKMLAGVQENEKQLRSLQQALNQNLQALANTGTFEEALHSLTAAIHLFTARAGTAGGGGPPRVAA